MPPTAPISVALIHGYEVLRLGLRTGMEREGLCKVVLDLAEPKGLAAAWPAEGVQVVVLYLCAAMRVSLDVVEWVRAKYPGTGVLVVGELTPALARCAAEAKVRGLLHITTPMDEMIRGVCVVAQGGLYANGAMREQLLELKKRGPASEPEVKLSAMQLKVLRLLCRDQCMSRAEIAEELGIGKRTVDDHIMLLFKKYNVDARQALVLKVLKRGLLP